MLLTVWMKSAKKALILTLPGVNFVNILQAAFVHADPKSSKKNINLTVFFALLGSAHINAAMQVEC